LKKPIRNKFKKIQDLISKGFICEVVSEGWENWEYSDFGVRQLKTSLPAHKSKEVKLVSYRGLCWYFNLEGELIRDDCGIYGDFETALQSLFEHYEYLKNNIDEKGFIP
jgi:hypothetical protein